MSQCKIINCVYEDCAINRTGRVKSSFKQMNIGIAVLALALATGFSLPAQAADTVIKAMVDKPHEINTALGTAGELAHTVAPRAAFRVLNLAYQVFPDSAAAKGQKPASGAAADAAEAPTAGRRETEQMLLAQVFRGVHW